jgi:hypothetical protein
MVVFHFEMKIMEAFMQHKAILVIALAALSILAYAIPYGIDVEAKKGDNNGLHYGLVVGEGYGLNCDHHKPGTGPLPCR